MKGGMKGGLGVNQRGKGMEGGKKSVRGKKLAVKRTETAKHALEPLSACMAGRGDRYFPKHGLAGGFG